MILKNHVMTFFILTNLSLFETVNQVRPESQPNGTPFAPNSSSRHCIDQIGNSIRDSEGRTFRFAVVLESSGRYLLSKDNLCGRAESKCSFFMDYILELLVSPFTH